MLERSKYHVFLGKQVLALEVYSDEGQGITNGKKDSAKVLPYESTNYEKY